MLELRSPNAHLLLQQFVLLLQFQMEKPILQQVFHAQHHLGVIERLRDEILRACEKRAPLCLRGDIGREHQNRKIAVRGYGRLEQLHHRKAIKIRHVQIEQHNVGLELEDNRERLSRVSRRTNTWRAVQLENSLEKP